ncbi:hypothetical protein LAZ67_15000528 [Cordylochernes scorpioides]|uniref:ATP-dependent DNA helicase n=1 Tax=Cordylochernes scorpioides TaxID=51811 RepID=A0ABY6LAR8_9ARAC|nr:hypothetical protein LAZ67_15000528 [Cordylochernes scorpioides]
MLQWPPILAKVQPHQRVQVTKRDSGTFVLPYNIGNGNMEMDESTHCIYITRKLLSHSSSDELIVKVIQNLSQNYKNNQWVSERGILAAKNIDANIINCTIQNEIYLRKKQHINP